MGTLEPVQLDSCTLVDECESIEQYLHDEVREFVKILRSNVHLRELFLVHDEIANLKAYFKEQVDTAVKTFEYVYEQEGTMKGQTIKMVGLRKRPNEPLGMTVELDEHNQLVVARILAGGVIDKQGLLHPGDVILEVNGVPVTSPDDLQMQISQNRGDQVTLKVGPSVEEEMKSAKLTMEGRLRQNLEPGKKMTCYMRAQFDYDPTGDNLLPCQDIGLSFKRGDILQIINVKDPNWWQARHAGTDGPTGLIPSQELEERRQAYVPPEADFVHKISICGTRVSSRTERHVENVGLYRIPLLADLQEEAQGHVQEQVVQRVRQGRDDSVRGGHQDAPVSQEDSGSCGRPRSGP